MNKDLVRTVRIKQYLHRCIASTSVQLMAFKTNYILEQLVQLKCLILGNFTDYFLLFNLFSIKHKYHVYSIEYLPSLEFKLVPLISCNQYNYNMTNLKRTIYPLLFSG